MTTANRQVLLQGVPEKKLLRDVTEVARMHGWLTYHTHRSDRSPAGFPDLCMVRCLPNRDRRLIFAELKTEKGKVSPAQRHWLGALELVAEATGYVVQSFLWRPSDFDRIEEILR